MSKCEGYELLTRNEQKQVTDSINQNFNFAYYAFAGL